MGDVRRALFGDPWIGDSGLVKEVGRLQTRVSILENNIDELLEHLNMERVPEKELCNPPRFRKKKESTSA